MAWSGSGIPALGEFTYKAFVLMDGTSSAGYGTLLRGTTIFSGLKMLLVFIFILFEIADTSRKAFPQNCSGLIQAMFEAILK